MNNKLNFQELYDHAVSIGCEAVLSEKMSLNTSFKTGGPCGVRLSPNGTEQLKDIITKANDLVEAYAKKIGEEINFEFGLNEGYRIKAYEGRNWFSTSYYGDCEEYQASREAENERHKKIAETVEEILISLELGGTRADLDEMLAKVGKGE